MEYSKEVNNCFKERLLKKIDKNKQAALQDLGQANFFLNESFDLIELNKKEMASIALYNAIFHSARAILFNDGIKEKSHYCLQKYLEYKSTITKEITLDDVALFDSLRGIRQEVQYNLTKFKFEDDLDELYNRTEKFIEQVTTIIQNPN